MKTQCAIYERRPKLCRDYPTFGDYLPEECTYYFAGEERKGTCACGVSACCAVPRKDGDPGGYALPYEAGGLPCKYIEEAEEKTAGEVLEVASDIDYCVGGLKEVAGD